jgi:DNA-binding PadR family transcriptional regulator
MHYRNYERWHEGPRKSYARHGRHRSWSHGYGGRRARRGDVRAAILALLAERPMHGYEMIQELEERTKGTWKPSAGSIYPTLQLLEDEGLIKGTEADGKRQFELTEDGRTQNDERTGDAPWEEVTAGANPEVLSLAHSLKQINAAVAQVFRAADDAQRARVRELLDETRRKIYGVLSEDG